MSESVQISFASKTEQRDVLKNNYQRVRNKTEELCIPLATEDYVPQPIEDVSPPRWHLAHSTWFFETFLLKSFNKRYKEFHPKYSFLFNSYYQTVGERWQRVERGHLSRPTVQDIYTYRKRIDEQILALIDNIDEEQWPEFRDIMTLGLNHEQQHQELLLTDLKYILCRNPLWPVYNTFEKNEIRISLSLPEDYFDYVEFDRGVFEVGYEGNGFYFDNEGPVQKVYLEPFRLRKGLVTNAEFLEFMEDDGYQNFRYWLSEGWDFVVNNNIKFPEYWHREDDQWFEATLNGYKELDLNAPVTHISFYEAEAFATWAGKKLPTEFEWEVAAKLTNPEIRDSNLQDSYIFHPVPALLPAAELYQMVGDVWEWTHSSYLPYKGYKAAEGALGEYNGKFMINQMVLRGGSCATPADHIRLSYRNFFHPDKRWQFTGIRLAE